MKTKLLARFIICHILLLGLFRALFHVVFLKDPSLAMPDMLYSYWLGLLYDFRFAAMLSLPLMIGFWRRSSPFYVKPVSWTWSLVYSVLFLFWGQVYIANYFYYGVESAFLSRDLIANFDFAEFSFIELWESYPLIPGLLSLWAFAAFYILFMRFVVLKVKLLSWEPLWLVTTRRLGFMALLILGVYGSFGTQPLQSDDAFFNEDHQFAYLSLNPIVSLFAKYEVPAQTAENGNGASRASDSL